MLVDKCLLNLSHFNELIYLLKDKKLMLLSKLPSKFPYTQKIEKVDEGEMKSFPVDIVNEMTR